MNPGNENAAVSADPPPVWDLQIQGIEFEGFTPAIARRVSERLRLELEKSLQDLSTITQTKAASFHRSETLHLTNAELTDPRRLSRALARFIIGRIAL